MNKFMYTGMLFLLIIFASLALSQNMEDDLSAGIVRLHIIANSDSSYDQSLKIKVRDAIQKEMSAELSKSVNKTLFKESLQGRLDKIEQISNNCLHLGKAQYSAKAEYGVYEFPQKQYEGIILPKGKYTGIRVILGAGEGHNWWCIMYPPMCFNESPDGRLSDEDCLILKSALDETTYDTILSQDGKPKIKLKLVEIIRRLQYGHK